MHPSPRAFDEEHQTVEATFQVVLKGVRPNVTASEARAKLAALFKASPEQIDKLLVMRGYVVKKALPLDVATKYKNAIEAAGGVCELIPEQAPNIALEVDLPRVGSTALEPKEINTGDDQEKSMKHGTAELSKAWQRKFALIEKAGGPDLPNVKSLGMGERMVLNFNIWGFLFGPFYYLAKGMWKKGLVLTGIVVVALVLLDTFFGNSKAVDSLGTLLGPVLFATQSNTDYYKKMVLGINKWW